MLLCVAACYTLCVAACLLCVAACYRRLLLHTCLCVAACYILCVAACLLCVAACYRRLLLHTYLDHVSQQLCVYRSSGIGVCYITSMLHTCCYTPTRKKKTLHKITYGPATYSPRHSLPDTLSQTLSPKHSLLHQPPFPPTYK
jgi:hypothetical protein